MTNSWYANRLELDFTTDTIRQDVAVVSRAGKWLRTKTRFLGFQET